MGPRVASQLVFHSSAALAKSANALMRCLVLLFSCLLVLLAAGQPEAAAEPANQGTAYVPDSSSLLAAFQDQRVSRIVLTGNVNVGSDFSPYVGEPIPLERNLTITGRPGTNPLLDLNKQPGAVQLCSTCILRIVNASVANTTRHGVGALTFFKGQSGSRIEQQNSYSLRLVCPSNTTDIELVRQAQRSALFPSPPDGAQLVNTVNASYMDHAFPYASHAVDASFDVPLTLITARALAGGFAVHQTNVTYLCWNYVTDDCVASGEFLDVCVAKQTEQLLGLAAAPQHLSAPQIAGIAIGAAIGALLMAGALLALHRRRRSRRNTTAHQDSTPGTGGFSKSPYDLEVVVHANGDRPQNPPPGFTTTGFNNSTIAAAAPAGPMHTDSVQHQHEQRWPSGPAGSNASMPRGSRGTPTSFVPETPSSSMAGAGSVFGPAGVSASPAAHGTAAADKANMMANISGHESTLHNSNPLDSGVQLSDPQSMGTSIVSNGHVSAMAPLAVGNGGWQLTSSHIEPGLQAAVDAAGSAIEWGELLGAGSFGRVYKCRWAGMDVAVKVIQHDSAALNAVENEVQLQMYLQHPNIVRAYHYVTHTHKANNPNRNALSSARSGGGLAASIMTRLTIQTALDSTGTKLPATGASLRSSDPWQQQRTHLAQQRQLPDSPTAAQSNALQDQQNANQSLILFPDTPAAAHPDVLQRMVSPDSFTLNSVASGAAASLSGYLSSTGYLSSSVTAKRNSDGAKGPDNASSFTLPGDTAAADQRFSSALNSQEMPAFIPFISTSSTTSSNAKNAKTGIAGLAAGSNNSSNITAGAAAAAAANDADVSSSNESNIDGGFNSGNKAVVSSTLNSSGDEQGSTPPPPGWPILMLSDGSSSNATRGTSSTPVAPGAGAAALSGLRLSASGVRVTSRTKSSLDKRRFKASEISETWLVQELCDCGTLASIAANYWSRETEDDMQMLQRLLLLQDVARGLEFLHSKNIVHSDLNANNVLVSSCDSSINGLVAKLADLGLSRVINQHRSHRTTHTFGTLSHMPPCLLREGRLSTRADVYAFGVMMWELYTGEPAWQGLHYGQFFQQVVLEHSRPEIPADMPEDYACLMTHCWAEEPNDRPTAGVVLHCLQLMVQERMRALGATESDGTEMYALTAEEVLKGGKPQQQLQQQLLQQLQAQQ